MSSRDDAVHVLGTRIDATSYAAAAAQVLAWARSGDSRYVCAANVHMVMEAYDAPDFRAVVNGADLVTPDGMPLVWYMRALGLPQQRVYGPDLMLAVCEEAGRERMPVGLLGATEPTLKELERRLRARFPAMPIAFRASPPYRHLSGEEDRALVQQVESSGARILFLGLGCPKQERWMASHRGVLQAVMLGVGAAFDFHAGHIAQAPAWMQRAGLEWLYRWAREPRRLFRRYARNNPRFLALAGAELARKRLRPFR